MAFKVPIGRYTEASVEELRAFLSCTHRKLGEGSLPWRLAQRGPQLLLLIAEFVLAPKVVLYAGCEDGRIKVLELLEPLHKGSRLQEVQMVATSGSPRSRASFWTVGCPQRVSGLAVGDGCLLAAMFSGTLRVFSLPSHDEQVSVHLQVLLPPQSPVIVRGTGLVASRRALYVVGLSCGNILQEAPLLFAARPCIIAEASLVFVQCDEAIRVWNCSSLLSRASSEEGTLQPQDFWNPHRQMLVGMAVLPGARFLATASPEEVRGWAWPQTKAPCLLWTVPTGGAGCEATSLLWLPSFGTGRLAVFGECSGALVVCELQLCHAFAEKPCSLSTFQLPGGPSVPAATMVPPATSDLSLTVWSEAGWFSFGLSGPASPLKANLEQTETGTVISSLACYGPLATSSRFF
ncbi:unnamed protein product [Effrenium voratum]|nr:unnamed protein product [Effrenium voratum]